VTRERLLYRDFANRHSIKGGPLTPLVFEKLVRELAGTAQAAAMANLPFAVEAGTVVGRAVAIHSPGGEKPIAGAVTYVSTEPEYTPPVIYSNDTRAKLVFMIEARPDAAAGATLHPGQPVDVRAE